MSTKFEVEVQIDRLSPISLKDYSEDGQWDLMRTSAVNLEEAENKTKIRYTFILERRRTFYLLYMIVPVFFLSLTSSIVFLLPPDEGEKTGTGITVVLAFAVYLSIVADLVPNTSLQVSILAMYLTLLLGLTALSLLCCVFIIRIHFRESTRIVGPRTIRVVRLVRKLTLMKPLEGEDRSSNSVTPIQIYKTSESEPHENGTQNRSNDLKEPFSEDKQNRITWQDVAATYDWGCMIFFTGLTFLITIACLLALEIGSSVNAP